MNNITASEVFNFVTASTITGESSFDIWKSINPEGTPEQFIEELRGDSSYEWWKNQDGNQDKTEQDYINSLKVISSNYDLWISCGYEGTPQDFIDFLKGKSAYEIWLELDGNAGKTKEDFINLLGQEIKENVIEDISSYDIEYDNTISELESETVQDAIDELKELTKVAPTDTDYSTFRIRNIAILNAMPETMNNGDIALIYK